MYFSYLFPLLFSTVLSSPTVWHLHLRRMWINITNRNSDLIKTKVLSLVYSEGLPFWKRVGVFVNWWRKTSKFYFLFVASSMLVLWISIVITMQKKFKKAWKTHVYYKHTCIGESQKIDVHIFLDYIHFFNLTFVHFAISFCFIYPHRYFKILHLLSYIYTHRQKLSNNKLVLNIKKCFVPKYWKFKFYYLHLTSFE